MCDRETLFAFAQTFEVTPGPSKHAKTSQPIKKEKAKTPASPQAAAPEGGIGWGSGIEVARNARAAEEALQRPDYRSAELYATCVATAPQNTPLRFVLGYAARLAGDYSVLVSAFQRGLKNDPSSIAGLSGLAQTYAKMGRYSEAQDLLKETSRRNPKRE